MAFNTEIKNIHMLTTVHRAEQNEDWKSEMQSTGVIKQEHLLE